MTGERQRLPDRRLTVTNTLRWKGSTLIIGVGFDFDGVAREVFLNGYKVGSQFETLMQDACVTVSLLLQHGPSARELAEQIERPTDDKEEDGSPSPAASLVGWVLMKIAEIEAAEGPAARAAYAAFHSRRRRETKA